ncbi:hypothetical protein AC623_20385 [Bacillus sp. FJAT-27231]|uniref:hypothetical protein n=1 Tax=Bacillus sp. FJAT-27231 TaxID=1679168 RepID=UPI00067141A9|nr:hypothetical protein [Bacillus sp. FJAT-27231]KMY52503.1 hypothetical protein AC623_20385 [Bacillus sp. FJAT-27231]
MEVKIRNLDPVAIKKIDELAKKKGLSRQEFLKGQIETLAVFHEQSRRETHLQTLIEKNIYTMTQCYEALEKVNDFIELMTGEEEE